MVCILHQCVYGWLYCRIPRNRQNNRSDYTRNHRFLRVPCYLDLYNICPFPYNTIFVFIIFLLMGVDINCRNYLLCDKLPQSKDGLKMENTGGRISIPCVFLFPYIFFILLFLLMLRSTILLTSCGHLQILRR